MRSRTSVLNVGAYKDLRKGFNIMSGLDLGICGFSHVGFAVPSVEQFAETWGSVLGIDNWSTHEESASGGVFVDGAPPAPLHVKVAFPPRWWPRHRANRNDGGSDVSQQSE